MKFMSISEQFSRLAEEDKASAERRSSANRIRRKSIQVLHGLKSCPELPEYKGVIDDGDGSST